MITLNTISWEIINFLVLTVLLGVFLFKPLLKILDQRRDQIQGDLNEAAQNKEEASNLVNKYEAKLKASRDEAQQIVAQAEKRANERREEILAEAREDAKRIKERAQEEIEQAKRHAVSQLRDDVSDISMLIASKFLEKSVDAKLHQKLVEEFIGQLDHDKLGDVQ